MTCVRASLEPRFSAALAAAFGESFAAVDPMLRSSDRADLQADVALALAKRLGKSPRDVAQMIVSHLDVSDICDSVELAGPGFINMSLRTTWVAAQIEALCLHPNAGVEPAAHPETVVVDYSGPNVAKEMHVGHVRSTVLGDSLARVLEALGHKVVRQNHVGDWGTPFGMLIEHLLDLGEEAALAASIADLDAFYKKAREKFDSDPSFAERARLRVVQLQAGDEVTLALWKRLTDASKRYFSAVYEKLGVTLKAEHIVGESFFNPMLPAVISDLQASGLAEVSDGAVCVFPAGFTNKEGERLPLIVRKGDGGYGYATTDLAALRYRIQTLGATRILYVVGAPQQQHFAMVFAVAKDAGWLTDNVRAQHVAFGSILGPDKKMFKTRAGGSVKLVDLVDEATQRAAAAVATKNPDLPEQARADVARQVGIGAIKYVDLSSDRIKDYVFDWSRMLAFEGNTAPYCQYAHARVRSIVRRAEPADVAELASASIALHEPAERALALELLGFGAVVGAVGDSLQPHKLCTYLYNLATLFSSFYDQCSVLKVEDAHIRRSRLRLVDLTARVLAKGLGLLGIEAPSQM